MTPHMKNYDEFMYFKNMKNNHFKIKGNVLGNPDAEVVVYEYSDFECPVCPIMNRMLQKASTELDNIFIIHYNYPLDMKCNPAITRPFHRNACVYAKFAIAAKKQNKYWEMINMLFEKQPKSNSEIFKYAAKVGIDPTELVNDFISSANDNELKEEIFSGFKREINATPTVFINQKKYSGVMTYAELKKILIEHGAIEKKK